MYTIQKIEQAVLQAIKGAVGKQYTPSADELDAPPDGKWGDMTFPCFGLAKGMGKPPAEIAAELAPKITPQGLIKKVEARGPYINFFIDAHALAKETLREIEVAGARYGSWHTGKGKRVMVEYTGTNTHKIIHVGHLRNFALGISTVNLLRDIGFEVVTASWHGDIGTHIAVTLWGLTKFHKDEESPKTGRGRWLGEIYAKAVARLEDYPEEKEESIAIGKKLAAGDKELTKLWKKTREWGIEEFQEIFKELGIVIDRAYYESELDAEARKIVTDLVQKGIAKESEGAIVVPLGEYGLTDSLILKSDGGTVYATRDLALAYAKFREYDLDRSVYIVDTRQTLFFQQLFKTLELIGFKKPMVHVPYEFVTLKEGAISSRKGTIVAYEDFRDEVVRVATEETKKRHADWSERKIKKTAHAIALAAMKIGMLAPDVSRPITFDIKAATSFTGFTGPYLQYTGARIAGILRKAPKRGGAKKQTTSADILPEEKKLLFALAQYPAVVHRAATEMRPAPLVEHLFGVAKAFAEFYEAVPVVKAEPAVRSFRLELVRATRTVLENGGAILGIEIPEEM
jgi:arginyl-tRNA synthetase